MTDKLHHPGIDSALTKEDIGSGVRYITYVPGSHVVETGTFIGEAVYDGESDDRWVAPAEIKSGREVVQKLVYLFDAGITPDETGEHWSNSVTILDDTE